MSFSSDYTYGSTGFNFAWRCSEEFSSIQDLHDQSQKRWDLSWTALVDLDIMDASMMLFNFYDENDSIIAQSEWQQAAFLIR